MHSTKDHIELSIEDLKNARINLLRDNSRQVQRSLKSINTAIEILEAYKKQINQRQYQFTPLSAQDKFSKQRSKIYIDSSLSQESSHCGQGYHWVRRALKNGESGYCRKNPQRNK